MATATVAPKNHAESAIEIAPPARRRRPPAPVLAAPLVAITTALAVRAAVRRTRREQAPPRVNWQFTFASGNSITFRPTAIAAPRFVGRLRRGRGRRSRT